MGERGGGRRDAGKGKKEWERRNGRISEGRERKKEENREEQGERERVKGKKVDSLRRANKWRKRDTDEVQVRRRKTGGGGKRGVGGRGRDSDGFDSRIWRRVESSAKEKGMVMRQSEKGDGD